MNKLYVKAAAVGVAMVMCAGQVFAATAKDSVKVTTTKVTDALCVTDSGSESFQYGTNHKVESTGDITSLLNNVTSSTDKKPFKTKMTVKSVNTDPVVIKLRMSIAGTQPSPSPGMTQAPQATHSPDNNPLDYYDWVVTASDGDVIYDSTMVSEDSTALTRDITLGSFNGDSSSEKIFDIEVKPNAEAVSANKISKSTLNNIKYYVVYSEGVTVTPSPSATVATVATATEAATTIPVRTLAPRRTINPTTEPDVEENAVATAIPAETTVTESTPTPAPTATPKPASKTTTTTTKTAAPSTAKPTATPKVETKVCGKDISAGRYVVSGNGKVVIKTKTGAEKTNATVRDTSHKNVDGVEQFVVNLEDGDVITVTPLAGESKSSVKFTKSSTTSTTKPATSTAKPKTSASPSPSKTNPKTGDSSLALGIVIGMMAVLAVSFGGLEVIKRKRKDD